jgi:hypothetical protein
VESHSHTKIVFVTDDSEVTKEEVLQRLGHLVDLVQRQNASIPWGEWPWWLATPAGKTRHKSAVTLAEQLDVSETELTDAVKEFSGRGVINQLKTATLQCMTNRQLSKSECVTFLPNQDHFKRAQKDIKKSQPNITADSLGFHEANNASSIADQVIERPPHN